jgi:low temperature requirement protein LtrA
MSQRQDEPIRREVSPLELFFDLVFVLAIGQLTHHLLAHLTWRGGAETTVLLIGVCGVWAFTTFQATLLDITKPATMTLAVTVMALGLFMNAGIASAFTDGPWLFVIPLLIALVGGATFAAATAQNAHLRGHFLRVLVWSAASAPLWVAGASLDADRRLWFWGAAALIDLLGVFTEHRLPGQRAQTERLPFDVDHMLERMRLFLIILLGETVLSIGRAVSDNHSDPLTLVAALGGFIALVSLWFTYFGRAERSALDHASTTDDPIRTAHLQINVIYAVVLGLVTFAGGAELVIAHPDEPQSGLGGVLLLGGPVLYLGGQAIYFHLTTGRDWQARVLGAGLLAVGAVGAYWLPATVAIAMLVIILVALAVHLSMDRPD